MVIQGLTDYLALSGELANTSDVEVLVNGASVGKRHFGPDDGFARRGKSSFRAAQVGSGGQVTIRKSGNGITYWTAESLWYSADRQARSSRASWRSTSRAIITCSKRSRTSLPTPSPMTWFRSKARCMWAILWPCAWR